MISKYSSKLFFTSLLILFFINTVKSQALSPGDIAFVAFNADGSDEVAFVALVDIPANTTIWFTDNEWDGDSFNNLNEGEIQWSHTSIVSAGTVILMDDNATSSPTVNIGTVSGSNMNLGASNEELFALLSEPSAATMPNPYFVAGIANDLGTSTLSNTGLTAGTNFIDFNDDNDGYKYTGAISGESSFSDYLPLIMNSSNWQIETQDGDNILPISTTAFTIASSSTTWTGGSTDWADANNWDNGVPTSSLDATIPDGLTNKPVILDGTGASVNNLTINEATGITIFDGGSLIVAGSVSGVTDQFTYKRELTANDWYLVSPPVAGQNYDDTWATNNNVYVSSGTYGIAGFNYITGAWAYASVGDEAKPFTNGLGYALKLHTTGDVTITGTFNSATSATQIHPDQDGYNLVGNPYPSFLDTSTMMAAQSAVAQTIWIWRGGRDGGSSTYETYPSNLAPNIAPGQGFFVKCSSTSNFNILEDYQTHESTDTFERPLVNPEIYLKLTDDSKTSIAKIYYIEGTTTSFDNGYDGEMFGASSNAFAIYTHLVGNEQGQVGNSQGHGYAVQSLPTDNYENMIVPVGVNATRGTTINIEATLNNFPEGVNVYLADKQENSVTLLETNTNYSTTLEEDLNGVGRFYIHTTPNALSSGEVMDSIPLSIYSFDSETLHIEGVATGTAYLQLYTMLGKELLQTSFEGTGVNEILLPNHLNAGIYIVKIATATGVTTKKIMIN